MSIRVMTAVWDLDLPPSEKLVLLALADWSDDAGWSHPSIAKVAKKTGVSDRTVQRVLREAEKSGFLERVERLGHGCKYRLTPRHSVTPDNASPVTNATKTPDTVSPNTSGTVISRKANASLPRAKFAAPDGVSVDQWKAFRQQRKKPLNERSYTLLCNKLREFAEDGYPPGDLIDLATLRGWESVFKPRETHDRTNQHHPNLGKTSAALIDLGGVRDDRPM